MSIETNPLQKIANTVMTFARIAKDKTTEVIQKYTTNEKHNIERLYPKKNNFTEYLSDQMFFFAEPTLVYPCVYLGSTYNALLWQTLVDNNIKYIINVTNEITNYYPKYITYYQIPIKDNNNESMQPYFDESFNKIEEFLNNNDGNVLVHCFFGASRSVTIIIDYLRRKTGKSVDEILIEIKKLRPIINPTHQFIQDLKNNEQYIQNSTNMLDTFGIIYDQPFTNDESDNIEKFNENLDENFDEYLDKLVQEAVNKEYENSKNQ